MTNYQCYCYAMVAILDIQKANLEITDDVFYDTLYYLWDNYSEEDIEKLYKKRHY